MSKSQKIKHAIMTAASENGYKLPTMSVWYNLGQRRILLKGYYVSYVTNDGGVQKDCDLYIGTKCETAMKHAAKIARYLRR